MSDPARRTAGDLRRPRRRREAGDGVLHRAPRPGGPGPAGGVRHERAPRLGVHRELQRGPHPRHHARRSASTAPAQGIDGPLFLGADTHALSEPATVSALEVLLANGVDVLVDSRGGYTPDPVGVARDPRRQRRRGANADGICVTPSHNPPSDGGFKYNPPDGGPAGTDITGWIQDRANELLRAGLAGREAGRRSRRATAAAPTTSSTRTSAQLGQVVDLDAIRERGRAHRRRPARRRERRPTGARSASATAST